MAKRKVTPGYKTKSKKNKKSKKVKSKKSKLDREWADQKVGLGLKDICTALTGLQVDANVSKENEATLLHNEAKNFPRKSIKKDRKKKERMCHKVESNISKLFQKLTCGGESSDSKASVPKIRGKLDSTFKWY